MQVRTNLALSQTRERGLRDLIGSLYDASTDANNWPGFLSQATDFFGGIAAQIGHYDPSNAVYTFNIMYGLDLTPDYVETLEKLIPTDPRYLYSLQYPNKPIHCRMAVTSEELHETEFYRKLLAPNDIEYTAGVSLADDVGAQTFLSIFRSPDSDVFNDQDCDLIGELIPHLKRAFEIYKRISEADFRDRTTIAAFEQLPIGIVITDIEGRVFSSNASAQGLTKKSEGITLDGDRLRITSDELHNELMDKIRRAVLNRPSSDAELDEVFLARGENETLAIRVTPLAQKTKEGNSVSITDRHLVAIFITDPTTPQEAPAELLSRLFGLTPAEARLLERLVAGDTVRVAANSVGVTEGTARVYLKSIFHKTDTNRQSELVSLVLSTPIWKTASK